MSNLIEPTIRGLGDLARQRFEIFLFIIGVVFLLIGFVTGVSTESGYRLVLSESPSWLSIAIGAVLCILGIGFYAVARGDREGRAGPEDKKDSTPLLERRQSASAVHEEPATQPPIAVLAAEQRRLQDERLATRVGEHPLLALMSAGRLDPVDADFVERARNLYAALTPTNKAIVAYVYVHMIPIETSVDEIFDQMPKIYPGAKLEAKGDLLHRVLLMAASGIFDVSIVGNRRTNVRKISLVGTALSPVIST